MILLLSVCSIGFLIYGALVVSGIYITEVKSVRGGIPAQPPKKKGFFARFKKEKKADK